METLVKRLDADGVRRFLERGGGVLVDTLPPEHFAARHIPGAVNACVYEVAFPDAMAALAPDKGASVVLYGAGPRSGDCRCAAEKLQRAGYADVAVFLGGLEAWRAAGHALEGDAPGEVEPPHPALVLEPRTYRVLPQESEVRWTGRNNNGGHYGLLAVSSGFLEGAGEPSASFTLDMASLRNLDLEGAELHPVLEAHLRSDDFFFTALFPKATFTTTRIRIAELGEATRPNAMLQGVLTLRGAENEIAFPAHIRNLADGRLAVIANLDFDRTQWGVIYGSSRFFQHLGYHVVFDFISVDFRLVLE
ncbi:YceI family protein [Pseudodesulfovibrio sp.]|uniref:YceI family protein n=1 Tax=Pseudodesulfovibrio sp. TaxID=2035812 RepID=UPI002609196A|nr:YceI family protein [Pseudodesulfovibrio sp.]MDD3312835.1 YceI family protein [Pseudodesulfovibrio sp.]